MKDIRWIQRLDNYHKALEQLNEGVEITRSRELNNLEKQGLIQSFEYSHELAWKVLKDFLESRGNTEIYGSRDATREAFQNGLISDGETWMSMITSRNKTSHTYNEDTAKEILNLIITAYTPAMNDLKKKLDQLAKKEQ